MNESSGSDMNPRGHARYSGVLACLRVFAHHYRSAPLQAGATLLGICLSVLLLTAVKSINENAKHSYREAAEPLTYRASYNLLPAGGATRLSDETYFRLKGQGLALLPMLQGVVTDSHGQRLTIEGIDTVAALSNLRQQPTTASGKRLNAPALPLSRLVRGEPVLLTSQTTANRLAPDGTLEVQGITITLVPLAPEYGLGNRLVADLAFAKSLFVEPDALSAIAVLEPIDRDSLDAHLKAAGIEASRLEIVADDSGKGLLELTDSFHISLKAMGMLAFVVGLFIAYNGVRYSLMKRTRLMLQLRQLGISRRELLWALLTELLLLLLFGTLLGFVAGLWLGEGLMPLVANTLEQIYGARLLPGHWRPAWLLEALLLTSLASGAACIPLMARLVSAPLAAARLQRESRRFDARALMLQRLLALILLGAALILVGVEDLLGDTLRTHLADGFLPYLSLSLVALVTPAAPLLLPSLLSRLPALLLRLPMVRPGLGQYLVSELRQLAPALSLAMMAMLLALSANIAMTTLVGSFEGTLRQWLNARLHADIYLRPGESRMTEVMTQLATDKRLQARYRQYGARAQLSLDGIDHDIRLLARDTVSVSRTSILKHSDPALWQAMQVGDAPLVLVNEPLALRLGIDVGQRLELHLTGQNRIFTVTGIYYDHGNQTPEALITEPVWLALGLSATPIALALDCGDCNAESLAQILAEELKLSPAQIYSQQHIKSMALTMFGRTFEITASLGTLTLLVAAIGLFSALSMLSASRENSLARLHALGVSRRELLAISALQVLLLVVATALLAIPFAWALAWLLIHKVILLSFGWSLVMDWQWWPVVKAISAALLAASLALAWPLWRLSRRPLVQHLQQEAL